MFGKKKKKEKPEKDSPSRTSKPSFLFRKGISLPRFGLSSMERINFFRDLSVMISVGISVVESLDIIAGDVRSRKARRDIRGMAEDIKNGQSLHQAMKKHPRYFPGALPETVRMGEVAGKLVQTLDRISLDLEKKYNMEKKVIGALAYPFVVIIVMVIVAVAFMFYILPEIAKLFEELEVPVPLPTRILISTGQFLEANYLYIIGGLGTIILILYVLLKIKKTRYLLHHLMLRFPLFGGFIKEYNLVIFSHSLNSLMSSGVSIIDAIKIARDTSTNDAYKEALGQIHPKLLQGMALSKTLEPYPFVFPQQMQKIVSVGERSGKVNESMKRIADYYEKAVEHKTRIMTALIEPILMLIVAVVVGGLAISLFLPLYSVVNSL